MIRIGAFLLLLGLCCVARGDDYQSFAAGLRASDAAVNSMKFDTKLMYSLDEQAAREYFTKYFAENRMTHSLSANLGYPLECWGNNHANLEKGIAPALMGEVWKFFQEYNTPAQMSKALAADPAKHDHVFFSLCHLGRIARADILSREEMAELARRMFRIVKGSKLCDFRNKKIDQEKYPYVNSIKTQMLLSAFSFADRGEIISEFARAAGISGPRAQLISQYKVLTIDNGWFDTRQLKGIKDYAASMPAHLRFPIAVMCFGHTVSEKNEQISVHRFRATKAFNVFGTRIGKVASNQFPKDYDRTVKNDGFMIVLAHEYAHSADSKYLELNENLKKFKLSLIDKAGSEQKNYLRSMIEAGYFVKHKNEFVASLANQYFSSTEDMLRLALQKAKSGNYNHINQFALMASLYSDGGKTHFYRINERGTVKRTACPIRKRDALVTDIAVGTKRYHFTYTDGFITSVE